MKKIIFALLIAIPVLSQAQLNGSFLISGRVTAEKAHRMELRPIQQVSFHWSLVRNFLSPWWSPP